jgi:hypothetical protein
MPVFGWSAAGPMGMMTAGRGGATIGAADGEDSDHQTERGATRSMHLEGTDERVESA